MKSYPWWKIIVFGGGLGFAFAILITDVFILSFIFHNIIDTIVRGEKISILYPLIEYPAVLIGVALFIFLINLFPCLLGGLFLFYWANKKKSKNKGIIFFVAGNLIYLPGTMILRMTLLYNAESIQIEETIPYAFFIFFICYHRNNYIENRDKGLSSAWTRDRTWTGQSFIAKDGNCPECNFLARQDKTNPAGDLQTSLPVYIRKGQLSGQRKVYPIPGITGLLLYGYDSFLQGR